MLVLSRKLGQTIVIDDRIRVTVLSIRSNVARLGIEAPKEVPILREELEFRNNVTFPCDHLSGPARREVNQFAESGGLI